MKSLSRKTIGSAFLFAGYGALAGCAVYQPASIQSPTTAALVVSSVEMPEVEQDGSLRSQWSSALEQSLRAQSINVQDGAPYIADFALAVREADTGIAETTSKADQINWQSAPREGRFLDECSAKKLRGTLVLFDRTNGAITYRGESESDDCKFDRAALDAMASQLVADLVK